MDSCILTHMIKSPLKVVGGKCSKAALARLVGAHFFSPAHIMPLLEIVRTPKTAPQVQCSAVQFRSLGDWRKREGY